MYVTCYIHVFAWVKLGRKSSGASLTIWEFNESALACVTAAFFPGRSGLSNCYQCFRTLPKARSKYFVLLSENIYKRKTRLICCNYKHVNFVYYQLSYQTNWELTTLWVRNIPVGEEYKWIYASSYIWSAENDMTILIYHILRSSNIWNFIYSCKVVIYELSLKWLHSSMRGLCKCTNLTEMQSISNSTRT